MPEKNLSTTQGISSYIDAPLFDPKADSPLSDEALQKKQDRYAHFDAATVLPRIARESFGAAIVQVDPLGTGANAFDHLVFRLHTDDGRRVVCRINTDTLVAKYFPVETALYNAWRAVGIPSPAVYAVSLRKTPNDIDYMLLESVGATDLEKYIKVHPEEEMELARAAGAFLARLHSLPVQGFGILGFHHDSLTGQQSSWPQALLIRLDETIAYLLDHNIISRSDAEASRAMFTRHEGLLALAQATALHGDYHDANILLDETSKEVVAAIDLSQAKAGDPLYDIAFYGTYVTAEKFNSFCSGYFAKSVTPPELELKVALYQLRIYLSKAKLRKRFGYTDRIPAAIHGVERSLATLVKHL